MSDIELLEEYLLMIKSNTEVYVHGTLESSNEYIKELLWDGLDETLKHQENTFLMLNSLGSYLVEDTKKDKIDKVIKKLEKDM